VEGAVVSFRGVHSVHNADGLMNLWFAHADHRPDPPELRLLQALLDPAEQNLRLDRPHTTLHRSNGEHPFRRRRG
jgi:hypothetical protein